MYASSMWLFFQERPRFPFHFVPSSKRRSTTKIQRGKTEEKSVKKEELSYRRQSPRLTEKENARENDYTTEETTQEIDESRKRKRRTRVGRRESEEEEETRENEEISENQEEMLSTSRTRKKRRRREEDMSHEGEEEDESMKHGDGERGRNTQRCLKQKEELVIQKVKVLFISKCNQPHRVFTLN